MKLNSAKLGLSPSHVVLTAALLAGAAAAPSMGFAQSQATAGQGEPNYAEIVVTAQKRDTKLQETPIAITALSTNQLKTRQIVTVDDLAFAVPNMHTDSEGSISIRGVGAYATSTTNAPSTDINIDNIAGANIGPEQFDLTRLEVLRGPQGTLYGRNTTGGVISMITAPASSQFGGYLQADIGNYHTARFEGVVNIPFSDHIRERLSALALDRDGYEVNLYDGHSVDGRRYFSLRSTTDVDLASGLEARLVINYSKEDDSRATYGKLLCTPDPVTGCSPTQRGFGAPDSLAGNIQQELYAAFGLLANPAADYNLTSVNPANMRQINTPYDPQYRNEVWFGAFELKKTWDKLELVSDTGVTTSRWRTFSEFDQTAPTTLLTRPVTWYNGINTVTSNQIASTVGNANASQNISEEVRLASKFGGPFDFTFGGYYSHYHSVANFYIWTPALTAFQQIVIPSAPQLAAYHVAIPNTTSQSKAVFGEIYFKPAADTKITAGIRYTNDSVAVDTGTTLAVAGQYGAITHESESYGAVTGRIGVDQKLHLSFTDDSLIYANFSRGYKSGGLNPGAPPGFPTVYAPEYINAVQFGMKNAADHGRFIANMEGFYYNYSGLQLSESTPFGTVNTNADATVYGVEGEFQFNPVSSLNLNLSVGWLHTRIDKYHSCDTILPASQCVLDANGLAPSWAGNSLPRSPRLSGNFGASYTFDLPSGWRMTPQFNVYYQSSFNVDVFNTPVGQFGAWAKADASVTFKGPVQGLSIMAYVKNITNASNVQAGGFEGPTVGNFLDAKIIDPRLFGVEIRQNF